MKKSELKKIKRYYRKKTNYDLYRKKRILNSARYEAMLEMAICELLIEIQERLNTERK